MHMQTNLRTIMTDPISPISRDSRKRSTPSRSDDGLPDEHVSKKARLEPTLPHTPPPERTQRPHIERASTFEDEQKRLLMRSVAIALKHVGFDGADPVAMEAMCAEVESYASHFLKKVTSAMLNSRRSHPMPADFQYALSAFDCPLLSLMPHLNPPVPRSETLVQLEETLAEEKEACRSLLNPNDELSGESDRQKMLHIPAGFPSFPSKHTYKWTEKESSRETDPRKIREQAATNAKMGEEALRKLVKAGKIGQEKNVKKNASKDPASKLRHELWGSTLESFMTGKQKPIETGPAKDDNAGDDRHMVVNADRKYMRKGAVSKRKPPPLMEIAQL